jgi:DNA-binding NtrC family response regulator
VKRGVNLPEVAPPAGNDLSPGQAPPARGLLLVDDDPLIRETLRFALEQEWQVMLAGDRIEALQVLAELPGPPVLALVDLGLPPEPHAPVEGYALLTALAARVPTTRVLVLSGQSPGHTLAQAYALGAVDFVTKPAATEALLGRLRLQYELHGIDRGEHPPAAVDRLIGDSHAMQLLRATLGRFAVTAFPVLIEGESGTGKELVARALHEASPQAGGPFVAVNCAALSPSLIEAQLFGHARGAYTGAVSAGAGFLGAAEGGTLLLDELGELPLETQAKLLRVLEDGEYYRVGETSVRRSNARLLAATHRDLPAEVAAGRFREDLYHRISVLRLHLPPLRERGADRLLLFEWFRGCYRERLPPFSLDDSARARLLAHPFPGNVRELRNLVVRLGANHPGTIVTAADLHSALGNLPALTRTDPAVELELCEGGFDLDGRLAEIERRYLQSALRLAEGNLSQAARLLGLHRTTLYSRLERLNLLPREPG